MSNFTNSPLISLTRLSPHRNSPRNQAIRKITIHHFAGNSTIEAVSNFLAQPNRNASYNYGIGSDGRIVLIVNESDRAWASSSPPNDHQAVVIGVANNSGAPDWTVSDTAFNALIDLCVCIINRNQGIVQPNGQPGLFYDGTSNGNLTRHNMFTRTTCPGPFLQERFPEIARLVNERLAGQTAPQTPPVNQEAQPPPVTQPPQPPRPPGTPSGWATEAWEWAFHNGITDGTNPLGQPTREQVMQLIFNYHNRFRQ